ncbi:amidohydrolase [Gyrodon lividus]|nr:amidohydrolase [Gyrodon lividus]
MLPPALDEHGCDGCFSFKRLFRPNIRPCTAGRVCSPDAPNDRKGSITCIPVSLQTLDDSTTDCRDVPICFESCCDFSYSPSVHAYDLPPAYFSTPSHFDAKSDFMTTIGTTIDIIDSALRSLSLSLHDHPELMFEEKYAHDILTDFMESHGFVVTRQYLGLKTAWRAEFTHGKGGRTLGINSEMDALPLLGHACGHNLIAVSGVGVAIAVKSALKAHNIPGKVVLLGTPAEEGGGGKTILLERGGYEGMHACLMCHPTAGPVHSSSLGTTLAMQSMNAEFFGHAAHAGNAPWEGTNALDAAFLVYTSVSVLRQQIKPDHRVHGVIQGCKGGANVIPDYAKMRWLVRAPDRDQLQTLRDRVKSCFEGAATATGCRLKITTDQPYYDLRQNSVLAEYFSQMMSNCLGMDIQQRASGASTDFGNVTYEIPSLHPSFAIPTEPNGGNHTPAFAVSARSTEAHKACMTVTKGLAWTGFRVIADDQFYEQVREEFQKTVQ